MNLEEFESQYRSTLDSSLNQLQTTVLLLAQLEANIASVSKDLQNLSQTVEEFISEEKAK
ncbi:hypothetical protein [Gloeocapsopsis dulcis]|uniref:Uncharacterized protein n=1 Tax=Gloeocapsopsis dulcis AAB1 = 1H9 TaxID=1433147 RepID=A0A6N8G012_9CHRO|nr:hypothetical protein [Gloeocapsopsis dulcis]MUL37697.1 hypothetical protein [Gloeocapsopsis dulcis AAB1 = 1H9]WNN88472.1 hypothetical protein P0S91_19625 [Gloeocapsopsis dulcis]